MKGRAHTHIYTHISEVVRRFCFLSSKFRQRNRSVNTDLLVTLQKGSYYKLGDPRGAKGGGSQNHDNYLHVLGSALLVSATPAHLFMSHFVNHFWPQEWWRRQRDCGARGGGSRRGAGRPVRRSDAEGRHHPTDSRPPPPFSDEMWAGRGCAEPVARG